MINCYGASLLEKALLRKVEKAALGTLGQKDIFVTDVSVVGEEEIRDLNREKRGVDAVTDVLSFPSFDKLRLPASEDDFSDGDREGNRVYLGSVVICKKRAEEQAEEYGHSYRREFGFLFCHGLLHLLGFDHIEKRDEEVMFPLQDKIMDAARLKRGK